MAKTPTKTTANQGLENAIIRVLEEEQAARASIDAAHSEAQALLQEAHSQAQLIERRANQRIRHIHSVCDEAIATKLTQIEQDQAQAQVTPNSDTDEILKKAVTEIAEQLTTLNTKG